MIALTHTHVDSARLRLLVQSVEKPTERRKVFVVERKEQGVGVA